MRASLNHLNERSDAISGERETEPEEASVVGKDSFGASELEGTAVFFAFVLQASATRGVLPHVL